MNLNVIVKPLLKEPFQLNFSVNPYDKVETLVQKLNQYLNIHYKKNNENYFVLCFMI